MCIRDRCVCVCCVHIYNIKFNAHLLLTTEDGVLIRAIRAVGNTITDNLLTHTLLVVKATEVRKRITDSICSMVYEFKIVNKANHY